MSSSDREFDLVLWGATGFTGRLVAEYLLSRRLEGSLRWALGGRDRLKLARVRSELGAGAAEIPLLTGDAADAASMNELADRARVVCSTVGPYALYGSELVRACAERGTHYCDLTGEVHWMQRMIDAHQDRAVASGARIVYTCGFDSIPSDLGVFALQQAMRERHQVSASRVRCRVAGFSGGASGGTIASMLNMLEEAEGDRDVRRAMANPYALNPKELRSGPDAESGLAPAWDDDFEQWTAPFVMAAINTRVVRRSNALLGHAYGQDFRYEEAMLMGAGPLGYAKAAAFAAGLAGGMGAASIGPLRGLIRRALPSPGEGPDAETRRAGYWDLRFVGEGPRAGQRVALRATGDRDPGYGSTSKMLGESALCLALDPLDSEPGFSTPAAALGTALIERLERHAGVHFELEQG
ncbi:MAG: saccharopine dehydrogenase family protein [Myxococcota bacterium]